MDLKKLFSGEIMPNVYLIPRSQDLSTLPTFAAENDYALFVFEGESIHDMDEFLDQFEQLMKPPENVRDWNSFESHFRIANWIQSRGIVVVYKDFQHFMTSTKHDYDKHDFNTLIDIFVQMPKFRARASEKYQIQLPPFYVLLQGDGGDQLPIEQL